MVDAIDSSTNFSAPNALFWLIGSYHVEKYQKPLSVPSTQTFVSYVFTTSASLSHHASTTPLWRLHCAFIIPLLHLHAAFTACSLRASEHCTRSLRDETKRGKRSYRKSGELDGVFVITTKQYQDMRTDEQDTKPYKHTTSPVSAAPSRRVQISSPGNCSTN